MGVFHQEGDVDANGAQEVNLRTAAGVELLGQQTSAASLPVVIASNQSAVPISAASLPLPTGAATEATLSAVNTKLVNPSELAAQNKLFSMNFEVTGVGTTEIPVALFRNPNGSGKTVRLARLTISNLHQTANTFIRVRAYVAPTVTADGTSAGGGCTHVGQAGPSALSFTSPTVSANGTRIGQWNVVSSANALLVPLELMFILDANTQMLMTAQADGTNRIIAGALIWAEI